MLGLGTQELMIIGGILVLLFGATKIPQLMRGLGEGLREFKKASHEDVETQEAAAGRKPV